MCFLLPVPPLLRPVCLLSTSEPYTFNLCWDLLANLERPSVDICVLVASSLVKLETLQCNKSYK